jgi:hypothetical protein
MSMASARVPRRTVQAWVMPTSHDPESASALAVARARLAAGARLASVRRARVFELTGALPARAEVEALLHASTQFYNPHKERCVLRDDAADAPPVAAGEGVVLVSERGLERRAAAERWWRHRTGRAVEVREGTAWVLGFAAGEDVVAAASSLAVARDRENGLFANPHAQEARVSGPAVPLPWLAPARRARTTRSTR